MPMSSTLVSLSEIEEAAARVRPAARMTPLIEVSWPGAGPGTLLLKCENFQPMGAFKIRGAYNMLAQLSSDALSRGVITYSSGNHGQAVALAAKLLGTKSVIVMPTTAPRVKVEGRAGLWRRGDVCRNDLPRAQGARRRNRRRARADHGAAVRSRDDHRGPGHRRPRDPRPMSRRCDRGGRSWRRRAQLRGGRRGQAAQARCASRRRRTGRARPR